MSGNKATTLTLAVPAGTAAGDVLIASIAAAPDTLAVTPPAGWTSALDTPQTTSNESRLATFYRIATASEPPAYDFALIGGGKGKSAADAAGVMTSFSGVDSTTPIDAQGGNVTASSLTHTANAIMTSVPNAMLVGAFEFASSPTAANWNPSGGEGMTKILAQSSQTGAKGAASDAGVSIVMSYGLQASAGSSGTKSAVASGVTADPGAAHLLALRPASTLAHYAITVVSATVANCDYAQITISGHDASHNLIAPPAGRSLAISTSTGTGVWQGPGTVAGTGAWTPSGANNGAATYVWPGGETSFTVTLHQSAVVSLNINLNDGSVAEATPLEDPTVSFVDSAFRISNGLNVLATVGTQIAGKPSNTGFGVQTLYLQAVRTDTATGACTSLFPSGSDVSVEVGAQCNNPATCSRNLVLASNSPSANSATLVPNGTYAASMNFRFSTANAEAPFTLTYADAGQITLQFRAQLPSPPAAQYVQGTSNSFVVRPFAFAFRGANAPTAVSHGTDENATVLAAAGDDFTMTLAAYQWASGQDADNDGIPDLGVDVTGNALTPNFAGATSVGIDALGNLAGASGAISRASGAPSIAAGEWAGGAAVVSDWRYSEVGNVFLRAISVDYLGDPAADIGGNSGLDGSGVAGGYIGRFRPKQFAVSAATLTNRQGAACAPASSFTYEDEPLQLTFTVTAQNAQGNTTQNYNGAYAKLGATTFSNWALGARSAGTNLTPRIDSGVAPTGSWSNGVANVGMTTAILRAVPDNPDGPYAALQFGIAPTDSDGTAMASLDLDVDSSGGNDRTNLGVSSEVRFGRLRMDNVAGPEAIRLPLKLYAEYWDGTRFAINAADSCTSLASSDIALDFTPVTSLAACETRVDAPSIAFASGVGNFGLLAPGAGNSGTVLLTVNLGSAGGSYCDAAGSYVAATSAAKPYLLGRWSDAADPDGNPNTLYDDKPSARAAFGRYGS
ncbi:MAG TPA: DUF6701 domain-containing protein, partial [Burkholderiales bacterium]|nr:DUF6701 domain-containing protein [Burkholderiales bacterium]